MVRQFTKAELLQEILEVPVRNVLPMPDTRMIERPGWLQLITPSLTKGGLNEVAISQLEDHEADAVIDRTLAEYESLGLRFRWDLVPGYRPADLGERLAKRGMHKTSVRAMYLATDAELPAAEEGVTVEEVGIEGVEELSDVMARGWNVDRPPIEKHQRLMFNDPARRYGMFLARDRGVPAGTGGAGYFGTSAYLMGAVVLPEFRGRGLYRALVAARMKAARAKGIELATVQARATTSAPILTRVGFETVCEFDVYSNRPD